MYKKVDSDDEGESLKEAWFQSAVSSFFLILQLKTPFIELRFDINCFIIDL